MRIIRIMEQMTVIILRTGFIFYQFQRHQTVVMDLIRFFTKKVLQDRQRQRIMQCQKEHGPVTVTAMPATVTGGCARPAAMLLTRRTCMATAGATTVVVMSAAVLTLCVPLCMLIYHLRM